MFCIKCGNKINENDKWCSNCGSKIENNTNINPNVNVINIKKDDKKKNYKLIIGILSIVSFFVVGLVFVLLLSDKSGIFSNRTRTIMIYASPTNLESDVWQFTTDMDSLDYSKIDYEHVNVLVYTGGTKLWHNFVKNDENAIYKLTKDGFEKLESYDKKNMSSADTLLSFINYTYDNFKSDSYDLMFYDHGGALYGAIADDFVSNDMLSLNEIADVLEKSPFNSKNKLELIMFRTCLMGTLEISKVVEPYAKYLVASEDSIYMGGRKDGCLNYIENINKNSSSIDIAKDFINDYKEYSKSIYSSDVYLSYSLVDLSKVDKVFDEYVKFIKEIDFNSNYYNVSKIRSSMHTYGGEDFDMIDLYSFVSKLSSYSKYDSKKVLNAIDDAVLYFVTNDSNVNNGLSIYFPSSNNSNSKYLLSIYNDSKINNNYYNLLNSYVSIFNGKSSKAITANILDKGVIDDKNEFSIQLTEDQANEFASAKYIIMKKVDDVYYMPIFVSNDAYVDKNNMLKTNIANRIIKLKGVVDKAGKSVNDSYITVFASDMEDGSTFFKTYAVLNNWNADKEVSDWKSLSSEIHIMIENNKPVLKTVTQTQTEDNGAISNIAIDINEFKNYAFVSPPYKMIDKNGMYTGNTDEKNPIVYGYDGTFDELELEFSNLEGNGEYYCAFVIKDIYGKTTNTKAIKLTK